MRKRRRKRDLLKNLIRNRATTVLQKSPRSKLRSRRQGFKIVLPSNQDQTYHLRL